VKKNFTTELRSLKEQRIEDAKPIVLASHEFSAFKILLYPSATKFVAVLAHLVALEGLK
jgi:hypothetical protein